MTDTENTTKPYTIDLTDGGYKKAFLAKITGPHPTYKLAREFESPVGRNKRHKTYKVTEDGIYEAVEYSAKDNKWQYFFRLTDGVKEDLTEPEVLAFFNAPEKGQAPARRSSCACTDGCCDNGCRCGRECNCNGGPIWNC